MKNTDIEIILNGITYQVSCDYQPEEEPIMYDRNMEGYPGCPSSVTIHSIKYNGYDILPIISSFELEEDFKLKIYGYYEQE